MFFYVDVAEQHVFRDWLHKKTGPEILAHAGKIALHDLSVMLALIAFEHASSPASSPASLFWHRLVIRHFATGFDVEMFDVEVVVLQVLFVM